jgi:hypothetical protein
MTRRSKAIAVQLALPAPAGRTPRALLSLEKGATTPARGWFDPRLGRLTLAGAVITLLAGAASTSPPEVKFALALSAVPLVVALALCARQALLLLTLLYLFSLGTLRRLLPASSNAYFGDPLLLVGPLCLVALYLSRPRLEDRRPSSLDRPVAALALLVIAETVNPMQGGITTGIGGLILILPPILAYWIGRSLPDGTALRRMMGLLAGLGLVAAAYGLWQTEVGFPLWDRRWVNLEVQQYVALSVSGTIRAFGSFSSAQEYAAFLGCSVVAWTALARRRSFVLPALGAVMLLSTALVLESSRSIVVYTVVALALISAARFRVRLGWALALAFVSLASVSLLVGHGASSVASSPGTQTLVAHEVGGLAQPFDSASSSLPGHLHLLGDGVEEAILDPLGHGVGSITNATGRFGTTSFGTELDPSNAGEGLGIIGLACYLIIFCRSFRLAYTLARDHPSALHTFCRGMITVLVFQWLNGNLYSTAWLAWLVIGWLSRNETLDLDFSKPDSREFQRPGMIG